MFFFQTVYLYFIKQILNIIPACYFKDFIEYFEKCSQFQVRWNHRRLSIVIFSCNLLYFLYCILSLLSNFKLKSRHIQHCFSFCCRPVKLFGMYATKMCNTKIWDHSVRINLGSTDKEEMVIKETVIHILDRNRKF